MSVRTPIATSRLRALAGAGAFLLGLLVLLFVLPYASDRKAQEQRAKSQAQALNARHQSELQRRKDLDARLLQDQEVLTDLEARLPSGSTGDLQWSLSKSLHALAIQEGIRLQGLKYTPATKEGGLDAVDVECTVLGLYQPLKAFMRAVEGAGLPFAVRDARLEESPEGARLVMVLRAFRPRAQQEGEEA